MRKIIIGAFTALAFGISSFSASADVAISGFIQEIIGLGDDTTGGITQEFSRINFNASTTADNGWEIGGVWQHEAMGDRTAGPSALNIFVATDMGTVTVGHTTDAVTNTISRVSAMVPGGGTDAGYQFLFFSGVEGGRGVNFAEAYYAMNGARVNYVPPSIAGVNIAIGYTPSHDYNSFATRPRVTNGAAASATHQETVEMAANYSGDMEGIGYTVAVGSKNGNGITDFGNTGNDLSVITGTIRLTQGAWAAGFHMYDNGDSYGQSTDSTQASSSGWNTALTYTMGNIVVGAGYSEMEAVDGTGYTSQFGSSGDEALVRNTNITNVGISYNLGGGVGTYLQMSDFDINDGDAMTSETSPQVIFAGISIGF